MPLGWRIPLSFSLLILTFLIIRTATWEQPTFGTVYFNQGILVGQSYWSYIDGHSVYSPQPTLQGWYWSDEATTTQWRIRSHGTTQLSLNGAALFTQKQAPGDALTVVVNVSLQQGANFYQLSGENQLPDTPPTLGAVLAVQEPHPLWGWRYLTRSRLYPNEPGSDPAVKTTPPDDQRIAAQLRLATYLLYGAIIWLGVSLVVRVRLTRRHWFFAAVFVMALLPRLLFIYDRYQRDPDFHYAYAGDDNYITLGRAALGGQYSIVGSLWGPGNIGWVAVEQYLLGPDLLPLHGVNALASAVMCLALTDVTRRLFGWRAAKGAALLAAFFPHLVFYQASPLIESMGTSVTGMMLWLLVVYVQATPPRMTLPTWQGLGLVLLLGGSLAWCGMFRTNLLIFALLIPLLIWLRTHSLTLMIGRTIPVALVTLLFIAPLTPLNPAFGEDGFIVTSGWQTIHIGNNLTGDGQYRVSPNYAVAQALGMKRQEAVWESFKADPLRAMELVLRKVGLIWRGAEDGNLLDINANGTQVSPLLAALYFLKSWSIPLLAFLGLMGIFGIPYRQQDASVWLLPWGILLFTLATALVVAIARLRVQLFLLLIISAGYALAWLTVRWDRRMVKAGLAAVATLVILTGFRDYLPRPRLYTAESLPENALVQSVIFDDAIELIGYEALHSASHPGGVIWGRLYFARVGQVSTRYTVSVVAVLPNGSVIQGDDWALGCSGYPCPDPATWEQGQGGRDEFFLSIPSDLVPPATVQVGVILYDEAGRRAPAVGNTLIRGDQVAFITHIGIAAPMPRPALQDAVSQKTALPQTFGNLFQLSAYSVDKTQLRAGETLTLTLDWQALSPADEDYGVYAHVLEGDFATLHGQLDGEPSHLGVMFPTRLWAVGQTVLDGYQVQINPDTPPGTYFLKVGFYSRLRPLRLPVGESDGLVLTEIEVLP